MSHALLKIFKELHGSMGSQFYLQGLWLPNAYVFANTTFRQKNVSIDQINYKKAMSNVRITFKQLFGEIKKLV